MLFPLHFCFLLFFGFSIFCPLIRVLSMARVHRFATSVGSLVLLELLCFDSVLQCIASGESEEPENGMGHGASRAMPSVAFPTSRSHVTHQSFKHIQTGIPLSRPTSE